MNSRNVPDVQKFYPGDNKISDVEAKFLLKHPGIKMRLDLGILQMKTTVTEDLVKEAQKLSKKESVEKVTEK